jgi:hypothetical protein
MANVWARDRANAFYAFAGPFALLVVLIGFSTTYFLPMAKGSFSAPFFVHLHGAACLAWVLLLITQAWMVRSTATPGHRRLGVIALPIALTIWTSGIATAGWAARRDFPELGVSAASGLVGTVTGLSIFLALVLAAISSRKRPDWHKRLILLATVALLWPAFFRWRHLFPDVPRPEIVFALLLADLPILIATIRDRLRFGRVHPVWAIFGTGLFVEQSIELYLFDSPGWREIGKSFYDLLA